MHKATVGFERSARAYDHGRPEYPPEAAFSLLARCGVERTTRTLELGAGTGKFSRYIMESTDLFLTSDPSTAMRVALHQKFPGLPCVAARADHIPLATGSVEVVICAQAFHWFSDERSVAEIARVLVSGGSVGLVWNVRDEGVDWIAALTALIDVHSGDAPRYRTGEWKVALTSSPDFGELQSESFAHTVTCDRATVLDRVGSISFIAALEPARHREVLDGVNRLLDTHPDTRGKSLWEFPYRTDGYWCERS